MLQMCKRNQDSEEIGLTFVVSPQVPKDGLPLPQDDLPLKNKKFSRELRAFALVSVPLNCKGNGEEGRGIEEGKNK